MEIVRHFFLNVLISMLIWCRPEHIIADAFLPTGFHIGELSLYSSLQKAPFQSKAKKSNLLPNHLLIRQIRAGGVAKMSKTYEDNNRMTDKIIKSKKSKATDQNSNSSTLSAPTVKTIISFAIPAIGIWLCGPLLSLIDTSAVGLLSGTSQQAALNPAITIAEDGALLVSFMYTATTNLVAAAYGNDRKTNDLSNTRITVITALQLAAVVGIIFGIGLGLSSTFLLKSLLGRGKDINLEVLTAAERYVRIRALGMPAAVVIGSAQSACLGMKDIRSPLLVMVLAAFVNLLGDFIFVGNSNALLGGAAGAAWATVISQYTALILFLRWLNKKTKNDAGTYQTNGNEVRINNKSVNEKENSNEKCFSTKGILHGHFEYRNLLQIPSSMKTAKKFWPYAIPVTTTAIGRVSGYVAMSHVVSSSMTTVDMAAQQIVLAFFLCLIPMCDSLNLTAQSFVPGIFEYKGDPELRTKVLKQTVTNFLKAGLYFGFVLMGVVACMPLVSTFFSLDPNVIASVNSTTLYLSLYALFSGIVCAGEGLLLGQKDLKFLSNSFTVFFFVVPYVLLQVKKAALRGVEGIGLTTVWRVFTFYQSIRCSMWLLRLRYLLRRNSKETPI